MKRCFLLPVITAAGLLVASCQSVSPTQPVSVPEATGPEAPKEAGPIGMVTVNASALNIRSDGSMKADILTQVKRGERLPLLEAGESWVMVQLPDGRAGWAASRFLLRDGQKATTKQRRKGACLPDSDYALTTLPTPTFSDSGNHGDVVIEAHVDADGNVKSTKLISNSTGDETLAFLTEREITSAKFIAPVRDCVPREFIYTYTRTF